MIVAGIDPSLTSTGVAILVDGKPIALSRVGHGTLSSRSYAHRSDRIVTQCAAVLSAIYDVLLHDHPDLAVIEGPAYGACNASTHDGSGLWWGLFSTLRARRIPLAVVAPKTRALFATGNGDADKATVHTAVAAWWPGVAIRGNDIADAAVFAMMGAHHLGAPLPFDAKQRQIDCLDVVKWPSILGVKQDNVQVKA